MAATEAAGSKEVVVKNLRPGMVLTSDIYTNDGVLIVPTGTKISLIILKKLYNSLRCPVSRNRFLSSNSIFPVENSKLGFPVFYPCN